MSTQKFWKKLGLGKNSTNKAASITAADPPDQDDSSTNHHRPPIKSKSLSLLTRSKQDQQNQQTPVPSIPPASKCPEGYILVNKESVKDISDGATPPNKDGPGKEPLTENITSIETLSDDDQARMPKMDPGSENAAAEPVNVPEPQSVQEQQVTSLRVTSMTPHPRRSGSHSASHSFSSFSSSSSFSRDTDAQSKHQAPITRAKSADRLPRATRLRKEPSVSGIPKPSTGQKSASVTPPSSRAEPLLPVAVPPPTNNATHALHNTTQHTALDKGEQGDERKNLKAELDRYQKINDAMSKDLEYLMETMEERDEEKRKNESLREDLDQLLISSKRQASRDASIIEKHMLEVEQYKADIAHLRNELQSHQNAAEQHKAEMESVQRSAYEQRRQYRSELQQRNDEIAALKAALKTAKSGQRKEAPMEYQEAPQEQMQNFLNSRDDYNSPLTPVPGSPSLQDGDNGECSQTSASTPSKEVPESELFNLTKEKEKLMSDYSKIPLSGGDYKIRKRKDELEDMLDKVDSQLSKVKQKIQQHPRF